MCLSILLSFFTNSSDFFQFNFFHTEQEQSRRQCRQGRRKALTHPTPCNAGSTPVQDIRACPPPPASPQ